MQKIALIVAGGKGERMNTTTPKQFLLLKGTPILMHTLNQFSHFEEIILVLISKISQPIGKSLILLSPIIT